MTMTPLERYIHADAERWDGWTWSDPRHGEHFRRCSFCGSMHPDDLAAEQVWHADWADRKYGWPHKFYVNVGNRNPQALFAVGSTYGGPADRPLDPGYIAWDDLTDEQRAIYERDNGPAAGRERPLGVMFGTRPHHFGKFYTIHLADTRLSEGTKDTIECRSGLRFTFDNDPARIRWEPYPTRP